MAKKQCGKKNVEAGKAQAHGENFKKRQGRVMICEFFWDFDGTLFDTYPRMARALVRALADLGHEAGFEWALKHMKRSLGDAARAANEHFGVEIQAAIDAYHNRAEDEGPESMLPYPGAQEMCKAIVERGGRNYLYTHRNRTALEALERWDMRKWFRDFVTKEDGFPSKPAPDALNFLLAKHALARENCAMVGDRPIDLQAGENAGMAGIFFDPEGFYPEYPARWRFDSFARMLPEVPKWLYDR